MTARRVNVDDFEEAARARLEPGAFGYFAGGAGDEHTLHGNSTAFERWHLRPRVLVDVAASQRAVASLAQCALRHGGLERVELTANGEELTLAPITPASAPVVLGEDLRDLGAAIAVRLIQAQGGSVTLDDETLRIRLA